MKGLMHHRAGGQAVNKEEQVMTSFRDILDTETKKQGVEIASE